MVVPVMRDPERIDRMLGKLRLAWLQWPDAPLTQLIEAVVAKNQEGERQHLWGVDDDETEYALDAFLGLPAHPPCETPGCPLHDPDFVKTTREEAAEISALIRKARLADRKPKRMPRLTPRRAASVAPRRPEK